jgi:hypothetical protein
MRAGVETGRGLRPGPAETAFPNRIVAALMVLGLAFRWTFLAYLVRTKSYPEYMPDDAYSSTYPCSPAPTMKSRYTWAVQPR